MNWKAVTGIAAIVGTILASTGFWTGRITAARDYGQLVEKVQKLEKIQEAEVPRFHDNLALDAAQTAQIAALAELVANLVKAQNEGVQATRDTNRRIDDLVSILLRQERHSGNAKGSP